MYGGREWRVQRGAADAIQLTIEDSGLGFNYGPQKLDLSQELSLKNDTMMPFSEFAALADEMTAKVVMGLRLVDASTRIGFRVMYLYQVDTYEALKDLAKSLPALNAQAQFFESLGPSHDQLFRMETDLKTCSVMISLSHFEQNIQLPPSIYDQARVETSKLPAGQRRAFLAKERAKRMLKQFPKFGILLDLDAYVDFPPFPESLRVVDFITNAVADFNTIKKLALAK